MKNLKKLVSSSVLAIGVLFASSFAANSAVITHTIIGDGTGSLASFAGDWGTISVEVDNADLGNGPLETAFGDNIALVSLDFLELVGLDLSASFFEAVVDGDNIMAGIESFEVDADDVVGAGTDTWAYQMTFDAFGSGGFLDIFDGNLVAFGGFTLGDATVTGLPVAVSAPATIAVFSLAMAGLYGRRKQLS